MTREEQIIEKAEKESELFYDVNVNYGVCFHGDFMDGAKWADETMIDKACQWLNQQLFIKYDSNAVTGFINNFRKAMEE